jgi:hypothetical protein
MRALFLTAFLASLVACEHKVDEPTPQPAKSPASVPAPEKTAAARPDKSRCIQETPAEAMRAMPPSLDTRCPADDEPTAAKLPMGTVTFRIPGSNALRVAVEVAKNDHDRMRGLMFRKRMESDHGMIFSFDDKEDHTFWMHNTCIPLDMLFIDEDGLIVGIQENTPTMSDDTFKSGCPGKYVLELNAGYARSHGIKAGQFVGIDLS